MTTKWHIAAELAMIVLLIVGLIINISLDRIGWVAFSGVVLGALCVWTFINIVEKIERQ